ncbi:MAG TPA: peptidoglycan bridge formation glycyltransferase FemA/FemB family protein [Anaerolineae bacterium]|nr:peptidoglycan bridge formation glycyltransferase FemA/FemB family protein [Anaerolineae bacterium]HIQ04138.1 peptidoglycan bridge formation glycyltransferase FemA/FemB family protein [Anaerolineae bacterium]
MKLRVQEVTDARRWNELLASLPTSHVLQSWQWGEVKRQTGWQARRLLFLDEAERPRAAATLLRRCLPDPLPLSILYVPKGPALDYSDGELAAAVLAVLEQAAHRTSAIFVKIDLDVRSDSENGQAFIGLLRARGWQPSAEQIQFRNTALLDISPDEDTLLARMKSKWRYNIRLAQRRGVVVRSGDEADLGVFYELYAETSARDGFLIRPFAYYEVAWRTFLATQRAGDPLVGGVLLLAEQADEERPVAGLFLLRFAHTAWYMYGASSNRGRQHMPNHLLQWEAIRWARAQGCTTYDLWGAPDVLDESDPMWGVWRFKEGFGARFTPQIGAWDYPVSRWLYWGYTILMPRVLDLMRRRHR